MAIIEKYRTLAEKTAAIAATTKDCEIRNDSRVYHFQRQMSDFYISRWRKVSRLIKRNYE